MTDSPRTFNDLQELGIAAAQRDPLYADQGSADHGLPVDAEADSAGAVIASLFYKHLPVTFQLGSNLLQGGSPVRASRIRVWAEDIKWKFGRNADQVVTAANGFGGIADGDWAYPGMPRFGIVLHQSNGTRFSIVATSAGTAQEFQISNGHDVSAAVNDKGGTYGDNSGAYSLRVEILQL
jgi:hypothetical protein